MTPRSPRRPARTATLVAGALAGALALGACAQPVPEVNPEPPAATPQPVLSEAQDLQILEAVGAAIAEADEEIDVKLLEKRVTGPALRIRTSQLKVAAEREDTDLVTDLPTETQQIVVPTTQTWPRTSYAVSVQPEDLQSPRLMVLDQEDARADYKLWGWVRLFPSTTLPSFADASLGSEAVAPDDDTLLVSPTDVIEQYADVLTLGDDSSFVESFGDDPFREFLAEEAKLQSDALEPADGKHSLSFKPTDETVHAIRTADGGALVVGSLTGSESRTAEEGAIISPTTETEKALFGDATASNGLQVAYLTMVAVYVPPADAEAQIEVLGTERVVTSIKVP